MVQKLFNATLPGWQCAPERGQDRGVDYTVVSPDGERALVVAVKSTRERRIGTLLGLAARAVLELRRASLRPRETPLVVLVVPRAGRQALEALEEFMSKYAESVSWGLIDTTGVMRLVVPEMELDVARKSSRDASTAAVQARRSLFTDLRRWMLKIVLLREAPAHLWQGPRHAIESPVELARIAEVAPQTAYSFVDDFEGSGLLSRRSGSIEPVSPRETFERWYAHERTTLRRLVPVRSVFGAALNIRELLGGSTSREDVILSGHQACRMLGIDHTVGPSIPEAYIVGNEAKLLADLDLESCEPRDAELILVPTRFPESIRRAALDIEGLFVVDALQAALDMAFQPMCGREQAEYIVEHVLGWR